MTLKTIQAHRKFVEKALAHSYRHAQNLGTVLLQILCVVDGLGAERFASATSQSYDCETGACSLTDSTLFTAGALFSTDYLVLANKAEAAYQAVDAGALRDRLVEREEIAKWGSYRSRDLALAWINALMPGQPDAEIAG